MIIKSSTALCNDYSMVSDLAHEKAEQREETLKLRAKLGQQRPLGFPAQLPTRWRNPENGWRQSISVTDLALSGRLKPSRSST